jgi:hypothetical protein
VLRERVSPEGYAIVKYGRAAFEVTILEECSTQEALNIAEKKWIETLNCYAPRGYNIREGGAHGRLAESTKAKLRGRKHTEETRAKIRLAAGRRGQEWRDKLSAARTGVPATATQKAGLALGRIARWSPEVRERIDGGRGEKNPNARLTAEQVLEIRRLWATGDYTQFQLADMFHVTQGTISHIVVRRSWKNLPEVVDPPTSQA